MLRNNRYNLPHPVLCLFADNEQELSDLRSTTERYAVAHLSFLHHILLIQSTYCNLAAAFLPFFLSNAVIPQHRGWRPAEHHYRSRQIATTVEEIDPREVD